MLKTLLSYVREYRRASLLTPLCMVGEVVMEMIIPLLMASIIDKGVNKGDMDHIVRVGLIMIAAAGLGLIFGLLGGVLGARASTGFAKNLRKGFPLRTSTGSALPGL